MMVWSVFLGRLLPVRAESPQQSEGESRDVSLTIPARPDHLVLARLALSAVCRLTPLSADEIADLKLAVTEAANDYVDEARPDDQEGRLSFAFMLRDDRLVLELRGPATEVSDVEQELGRAIIDATVDESSFGADHTTLVKYLSSA
jgi:anti-sigma regulatory factor (Ser/Thr protein kinase)